MRALLAVTCLLLGCLIGASRADASPCVSATDFSFNTLNHKGSSMHFMGFGPGFKHNKDGSVTIRGDASITRGTFEFRPSACINKIKLDIEGSATVEVFTRTGSSPLWNKDLSAGKDVVAEPQVTQTDGCGSYQMKITVPVSSVVTVKEVAYCADKEEGAVQAAPSRRARSIDDSEVDEESIHDEATDPIVPHPFCNSHITNDGHHDYCYAVFSYESKNNFTLSLSHDDSYYFGAANVNQNPTSYYAGGRDSDLSAFWICDAHISAWLGLRIVTPMTNTTAVRTQPHIAMISRGYTVKCPDDLLEWFVAEEVPQMFDD